MNDIIKNILLELHRLQDDFDKAKTMADVVRIISIQETAMRYSYYLSRLSHLGYNSDELQQDIDLCNEIYRHCKSELETMANQAVQDAVIKNYKKWYLEIVNYFCKETYLKAYRIKIPVTKNSNEWEVKSIN